ncbi:MAG: DNA repair protein RadA [Gammaproteobacteria bacterium]
MAKTKVRFYCQDCGAQYLKWLGQCTACGAWNTLQEETIIPTAKKGRQGGYAGGGNSSVTLLNQVTLTETPRLPSAFGELDRVLGGGIVEGSVVLIGGDPGIGKSTLLLQVLCRLSQQAQTLYVTGEESLQQVAMRAQRLGLPTDKVALLAATDVHHILDKSQAHQPQVMVIDSIQTVHTHDVSSAPGSVSQVRESAARLVRYAKEQGVALILVGHVTKEGALAGPRVLEHMVDTVLYFEGQRDNRYRVIRAVKNRFGAVNELGIFAMTEQGLKAVNNPSAIFLSRSEQPVSGSVVMVTWEGTRPLLVEVQALVDESYLANPRRVAVGLDQQRLAMLLAVLHRHGGIATYNQDVFLNVVGGVRVTETAADLAVQLAVVSSLNNKPLPRDWVVMGEVGLAGEIRPVNCGQERLQEAAKHGFKKAIVPKGNCPRDKKIQGLELLPVSHWRDVLTFLK